LLAYRELDDALDLTTTGLSSLAEGRRENSPQAARPRGRERLNSPAASTALSLEQALYCSMTYIDSRSKRTKIHTFPIKRAKAENTACIGLDLVFMEEL
jgi:hypothetical protein